MKIWKYTFCRKFNCG